MTTQLRKTLLAGVAAIGMAAVFPSQAMADPAPLFTVDPANLGVTGISSFQANEIAGSSSELITFNNPFLTSASFSGWLDVSNFVNSNLGNPNLPSFQTGVFNAPIGTSPTTNYGLYITFQATDHLVSGIPGVTTSTTYALDTLTFQVYFDPADADSYQKASTPSTQATVTDVGSTDILLGQGSLINGVAGFDSNGGPFLNSTDSFSLTASGSEFFTAPVPFFNIAFNEFNTTGSNTEDNLTGSPPTVAILTSQGSADFQVPEPASLTLLGSGLLAMAVGLRRRRKRA